ncbi:hypothetical protein K3495_g2724 [Podosphaera aphanis]|nr:hypothetical protein K3495_g2724 [Podosphaera aphanis]
MAPESRKLLRKAKENQFPFDLGVKGRHTGLTLPQLGDRDENGLEPMDHLFSSPEKPESSGLNGARRKDTTLSEEEDMDMVESIIPDPIETLAERSNARLAPPKSKSPIKTYLNSPARRNASLGPVSSPFRGSVVEPKTVSRPASVHRKLEFSKSRMNGSMYPTSAMSERPSKRNKPASVSNFSNGRHITKATTPEDFSDEDEQSMSENVANENGDNSLKMGMDQNDESDAQVNESEVTPEPEVPKKERKKDKEKKSTKLAKDRRRKNDEPEVPSEQESDIERELPKKNERRRKKDEREIPSDQVSNLEEVPEKNKRRRKKDEPEILPEQESDREEQPPLKRSRHSPPVASSQKNAKDKKKQATNSKALQKTTAPSRELKSSQAQRGPPLPKGKGLLILRRETPDGNHNILRTRSGRNSIKPLAYWSNEKVEFEDEELPTKDLTANFAGRKIKHVIRAEEIPHPKQKRKPNSRTSKNKKRKMIAEEQNSEEEDDDDEIEPWEEDPGRIIADVRTWDPDDPFGSDVDEREEEIALSSTAIVTREIVDASFRFAKTLSLPFFGAGMVDLPPGTEKKQKNSRKMQLAFFVFYGKVQVTVNDHVFRISKGGMWQVPRGNFYGILNDYDRPARIFFSQGCVLQQEDEEEES